MAGPWEDYQSTASTAKPWEDYAPVKPKEMQGIRGDGFNAAMNYNGTDATAGAIRGAGSIGSTLLRPFESAQSNAQRRSSIDSGLTSLLGSNPESTPYQTTKLATEVLGTSGLGGALASGLSKMPWLAGQIPHLIDAVRTGGMSVDGAKGLFGAATRVAGGAVNGAATAGAIDPKDAGTGAMIGGAFPMAVQAAVKAGHLIGSPFSSTISSNPTTLQTAKESMDAGYVIPPSSLDPSFKNRVLESISGKQATQQLASTTNTRITEGLTRQALGIADDVPLTQGTLENLRKTAGRAYSEVSSLSPQAATDLEALKVARNDASGWFKAYNRSARPDDLVKAKDARALSDTLETSLEAHAQAAGRPELIPALRDARKAIAKTYTVSRALNDASGTVDAKVLGRMYEKQVPLSDGLDVAGKFASAFPTAAKAPQQIGSPAVHNLNAMFAAGGGGGGAAAGAFFGGPVGAAIGGAAGLAYPFVVPPIARSMMFSKGAQQGLLGGTGQTGLLSNTIDELLPYMYRTNPVLAGGLISGQ